ncbi:hypothetical protein ABS71_10905 [bacterium SCN 62-11]|nr:hypothetical protein [Candidatus Eremiobacteraeota bacterium]ODT67418.1 MAG: hypothetical protein ABS71_10905 [bacterium SCN 62-11]
MKAWMLVLGLSAWVWAAPPAEDVYKVVEAAGLPREIVEIHNPDSFPELAVVGVENQLKAVYLEGAYTSPNQATGTMCAKLDNELAVAWVTQVLLSFEEPLLKSPTQFTGTSDWLAPAAEADGAKGFKVKLWVREKSGELALRQYHLTAKGARVSVLKRLR